MNDHRITIIRHTDQLLELEGAWNALAAQPGVRPFQHFGWLSAWARTIGTTGGRQVHVATSWQREKLVAVLPLTVRSYNGVRLLEWLGAKASDYCDALVDASVDSESTLRALWTAVARQGGFDLARLGQVRTDAHVYDVLSELNPWTETREESMGIDIAWPSGDAWLGQLSRKTREPLSYGLRRMAKLGFEFHVCGPDEPFEPFLDALITQKRAWVVERGLGGFLVEPQGAEFLHAAAQALMPAGVMHLSVVRSKDHIAACHLGFMHDGILYYYMPTYDAAWAKYSFGNLQRDLLIMWACDHAMRRFDMLLGTHDYKTRYTVTTESVRTLVVPRGMLGHAAVSLYRLSNRRARAAR